MLESGLGAVDSFFFSNRECYFISALSLAHGAVDFGPALIVSPESQRLGFDCLQ